MRAKVAHLLTANYSEILTKLFESSWFASDNWVNLLVKNGWQFLTNRKRVLSKISRCVTAYRKKDKTSDYHFPLSLRQS